MIVKNGWVFEPNGQFVQRDLYIDENRRICEELSGAQGNIIDATGYYVIPGLVDIHVHGACGMDFSDGDEKGLARMAAYLWKQGITSFCPTTMTIPEDEIHRAIQTYCNFIPGMQEAVPVGIHLEGPFLSKEKKGAQREEDLLPIQTELLAKWYAESNGEIRLLTLAPELMGVKTLIDAWKDRIHISVGHTAASYDKAKEAFAWGADHVTHLFNAMPAMTHRSPGPIAAAVEAPAVWAELICDGYHVHPAMVRMAFQLFGSQRMVFISDGIRAMGMPDGTYTLGGQPILKKGNRAILKTEEAGDFIEQNSDKKVVGIEADSGKSIAGVEGNSDTLAGSVTNLAEGLRNAVRFGIPLYDAVRACTYNPAKSIGMEMEIGQFVIGARGDFLLMDPKDLSFKRVDN